MQLNYSAKVFRWRESAGWLAGNIIGFDEVRWSTSTISDSLLFAPEIVCLAIPRMVFATWTQDAEPHQRRADAIDAGSNGIGQGLQLRVPETRDSDKVSLLTSLSPVHATLVEQLRRVVAPPSLLVFWRRLQTLSRAHG